MSSSSGRAGKPISRMAVVLAVGGGLGYLPIAPGTWGSMGGVVLYWLLEAIFLGVGAAWGAPTQANGIMFHTALVALTLAVSLLGVWASGRAALHFDQSDPSPVVVDEVAGQLLALHAMSPLGWKEVLVGFLLFRAFDIWKPFPARAAESLRGGWGIMADDWIAGFYAAIVLNLLRLWA